MREFQPFLLDAWRSLGKLTGDIDASLPSILEVGVRTGVVSPIEPSGVWFHCKKGVLLLARMLATM